MILNLIWDSMQIIYKINNIKIMIFGIFQFPPIKQEAIVMLLQIFGILDQVITIQAQQTHLIPFLCLIQLQTQLSRIQIILILSTISSRLQQLNNLQRKLHNLL